MRQVRRIGEKEVEISIERLPLIPGNPYGQKIKASHGGHTLEHTVTHDPGNFKTEDAKRELERITKELAERVAGMSDVKSFLDEFHFESPVNKS